MASKEPEEAANTATDEETLAFKKKRARRVSFADVEITSVHIFKRDDEYDTPPEPQPTPETAPPDNEVLGFFRDLVDSDDSRESSPNVDDDVIGQRKSFLRPLGSPSPGSSTAGSATSNDEDNFFGPVSASFIRPGRLSDSAASDDNHDVTMDSTAFSMHFRSLAGSDSGRDLKTPTAVRLAFEERTPTQNTNRANPDSFMALTKAKKLISPCLRSADMVRSKDSNEMSLLGENSHKFDYGRLSPTLDALLTEGSKDLYAISVNEKSLEGNEVCEVDQMGRHDYNDEISGTAKTENGSNEYPKHAIEMNNPKLEGSILIYGTPCKVLQSSGLLQENFSDGWAKVDSPMDRRYETNKNLDYKLQYISPSKRSLSVEQKTFLATPNSPALALVTPNLKLLDYSSMESMKFGKGLSSKQKSISKFRLPEPSPCVLSIKEGIDRLRSRLSSYSHMANLSDQPDGCKDLQFKHADIPVVRLEGQLSSDNQNIGKHESSLSIGGSAFENLKDIPKLSQGVEMKVSSEVGETHQSYMTMAKFSKMQPSKLGIEAESPSHVTWSGEREVMPHILMSKNPSVGLSASSRIDASTAGIIPDDRKQKNSTSLHDTLVSSSLESLDVRLLGTTECQTSCFGEPKQWGQQIKHVSACLGRGDAAGHTSTTSPLTFIADELSSLQSESGAESTSPFLKDYSLADGAITGGVDLSNLQNNSETFSNLQLSSGDGGILNSPLKSAAKSFNIGTVLQQFQKAQTSEPSPLQSPSKEVPNYSPRRRISTPTSFGKKTTENATPRKSTLSPFKKEQFQSSARKEPCQSPLRNETQDDVAFMRKDIHSPRNEQSQSSARKEPFRSLLRNEPYNETQDDVAFMRKDMHSPTSSLSGNVSSDFDHSNHILESSSRMTNHSLSGNKRRFINTIPSDLDHEDIIVKTQQSPKVSGDSDVEFLLEQSNQMNNGSKKNEDDKTFMQWTDMSVKFLGDTKNLLPPLINELNSKAIEKLEDILVHLSKVKEYTLFCSEIQSQKVAESLRGMHKRVVEARLLLCKVAYKKAKLQLMCAKHDGYLKRAQSLSSHIEDFQMLKLNYDHLMEPTSSKSSQVDDSNGHSFSINSEVKHEMSCDRISLMRQAFESLDGKIKIFSKYFSKYCKLKGETSSTDILASVVDHLRKKKLCRSICQDLQMWELDDIENKNDKYSVLLNYRSYAYQRFTIKVCPCPSITISNTLNDIHIEKSFPEMNACCAFAFVLNVEGTRKCIACKHLSRETQMTGSFLHNLLDVIGELQVAQIEITNLIQMRFHSPSDEQLDLQLSFIDFHSGRKIIMIMDVSDLNRGIYPSEVIPHKIESPTCAQYPLPESLLNDIRTAVGSLDVGYSRILRLCRCISEVVQVSSR